MKARIFLIFLCLFLLGGCGNPFKVNTIKPHQKPDVAVAVSEVDPSSKATTDRTADSPESIQLTEVQLPPISAGHRGGIYLGDELNDRIKSVRKNFESVTYGHPKYGSLKAYPNGHFRYYPPEYPCIDEIAAEITATDGTVYQSTLKIKVVEPTETMTYQSKKHTSYISAPKERLSAVLTIESPPNGFRRDGRVCNVNGLTNSADGEEIELHVVSHHGGDYPQDNRPKAYNGKYAGCVYLGDEYGNGVGEDFVIYATDSLGNKSNCTTVHRTK